MKITFLPVYKVKVEKDTTLEQRYIGLVSHEFVVEEKGGLYFVLGMKETIDFNSVFFKIVDCKILQVIQRKHTKELK